MSSRIAVIGIPGSWSSESLADSIAQRTGERVLIDADEIVADLSKLELKTKSHQLCEFDGIVVKKIARTYSPSVMDRLELLKIAQARGVRVFSPPQSMIPLIDRLSGTIALRNAGIPMPHTVITEDISSAVQAVESMGEAVVKPLFTSKARGMAILSSSPELKSELEDYKKNFGPTIYLQKKIQSLDSDLGVVFLGGKYLGTYARIKSPGGGWATSTSQGGRYQSHDTSPEIIELAHKAQSLFKLDFTCVDVVEDVDGPKVFEVSAFGGFRGLEEACGINAADAYAQYVVEIVEKVKS